MLRNSWKPAIALAIVGFLAGVHVARAAPCEPGGNNCPTPEAPLPLLGASPFALMAIGGAVYAIWRKRDGEKRDGD